MRAMPLATLSCLPKCRTCPSLDTPTRLSRAYVRQPKQTSRTPPAKRTSSGLRCSRAQSKLQAQCHARGHHSR
ncbi:hypothetical protein CABS01_16671 [Colletotrichum abscissum]|uniref:Uncharacterized protein n=1 Tax=Colletotrichum abscissum TaxID=1671311 RepID=A0A9Q0AXI0_9PEZI|nr:uncharacterized protein CABS01_16671 [Colletotrichum abscissum]KAI3530632.1 hypothetical protein CABS02_14435 [Colletotrichum abscissum]KAK1517382.1 hypothetical protein CABS01_16671 [Colletotrichum abscissum]